MSNNAAELELRAVAVGWPYTAAAPTEAPDTSDAALIRSIVAGDKGAMRTLFARHNVRVYRFLLRFVDKSAAEDLVSEVFLDVWRQAGRFQGRSQVTTSFWRLPATKRYPRCGAGRPKNWTMNKQQPSRIQGTTPR